MSRPSAHRSPRARDRVVAESVFIVVVPPRVDAVSRGPVRGKCPRFHHARPAGLVKSTCAPSPPSQNCDFRGAWSSPPAMKLPAPPRPPRCSGDGRSSRHGLRLATANMSANRGERMHERLRLREFCAVPGEDVALSARLTCSPSRNETRRWGCRAPSRCRSTPSIRACASGASASAIAVCAKPSDQRGGNAIRPVSADELGGDCPRRRGRGIKIGNRGRRPRPPTRRIAAVVVVVLAAEVETALGGVVVEDAMPDAAGRVRLRSGTAQFLYRGSPRSGSKPSRSRIAQHSAARSGRAGQSCRPNHSDDRRGRASSRV